MKDIVLIHRNVRMFDNPALFHGSKNQDYRVVYLYDQNYWQANGKSEIQLNFLFDCLKDLDQKLKEKNSQIYVFSGNYLDFQKWIETHFSESIIHANHCTDVGYFRDDFNSFRDHFLKKEKIKLYSDFGIQIKAPNRDKWASDWEDQMSKPLLKEPYTNQNINKIDKPLKPLNLFLKNLQFQKSKYSSFQSGGSDLAYSLLDSFLKERCAGYSFKMSSPHEAEHSCSRLSPHIAFGSVSIREIYQKLLRELEITGYKKDLNSFKKRLYWHCHFIQKLESEPELEFYSMHPMADGLRPDVNNEVIEKWILGETGFPFLDACIQYLRKGGWINFRMRAMIMSFASYNLWQPWQRTSPLLAELFVDYEPGIHICQVQMQSGVTGINLPRIYSVLKQSKDQDPNADWIKAQIPKISNMCRDKIHNAELNDLYFEKLVDPVLSAKKARETIWASRSNIEFKKIAKDVYLKHGSRKRQNARF